MNITICGIGEIGNANKTHLLAQGHLISVYDPPKGFTSMPTTELYIICVPSDHILDVIQTIRETVDSAVICIESTITEIGFTRKVSGLFPSFTIGYCPNRYWRDDPLLRGVVRYRAVGAERPELFQHLYGSFGIETFIMQPIEAVEWLKIIENAYRALQIAFAEEMKMLTGDMFDDIRAAVMTTDDMHWMAEARQGIGGHCLPLAMHSLMPHSLMLLAAKMTDLAYRKWLQHEAPKDTL